MIPIDDHKNLLRDPFSKAVINTDSAALQQAREAKARALKDIERKNRQEQEINNLRQEVAELKQIVENLLKLNKPDGPSHSS